MELYIRENSRNDILLYICPTKALVNDTYRRLLSPFDNLGLKIIRKTGDYPYNEKLMGETSCVIITLEGVDSLLTSHREIFQRVRFLVCDEIHLVDGTPRGDHLRILLQRIKIIRLQVRKNINFYISSATIPKPKELANRYFIPNKIIVDNRKKSIDLHLIKYSEAIYDNLLSFMNERNLKKCLIFCNTRKSTEYLAKKLKNKALFSNVYVHHASLSKKQRIKVEESFNYQKNGVCIATMTLELGIDIGDIDLVVMNSPPPNVSSFLQRLGRGCRRRRDKSLIIGWYKSYYEKLLFDIYKNLAESGELDPKNYYPKYSVCIQQLFSLAKEYYDSGFTGEEALKCLKPVLSSQIQFSSIINYLIQCDYFFYRHKKYYPTTKLSDIMEKHLIYSNISISRPFGELEVVNNATNDIIGYVSSLAATKGNLILLAGREWFVEKITRQKIYVSTTKQSGTIKTYFSLKMIKGIQTLYFAKLMKRKILKSKYELFNQTVFLLSIKNSQNDYLLVHFLGTVYGFLFSILIEQLKLCKRISNVNGVFIHCKDIDTDNLLKTRFSIDYEQFYGSFEKIKPFLNLGPYFDYLPEDVQKINIVQAYDIDEFEEILFNLKIRFTPGDIASNLYKLLLKS